MGSYDNYIKNFVAGATETKYDIHAPSMAEQYAEKAFPIEGGYTPSPEMQEQFAINDLIKNAAQKAEASKTVPAPPRSYSTAGYVDFPAALQAGGEELVFESILIKGLRISFKAFLTQLSDSFSSQWERESAYGRMDDVHAFKSTKRRVVFGWEIVAASLEEAQDNLIKMSHLSSILYPTYKKIGAGKNKIRTISGAPLVKIKYGNLISAANDGKGLLGTLDGVNYDFKLDTGAFKQGTHFFPKHITANCTFYPLHTHDIGWEESTREKPKHPDQFVDQLVFPYGAGQRAPEMKERPNTKANPDDATFNAADLLNLFSPVGKEN